MRVLIYDVTERGSVVEVGELFGSLYGRGMLEYVIYNPWYAIVKVEVSMETRVNSSQEESAPSTDI